MGLYWWDTVVAYEKHGCGFVLSAQKNPAPGGGTAGRTMDRVPRTDLDSS
jgi:hypothetical protein